MPRLSVIIPTWQEAAFIQSAVGAARPLADEVIVVDGGSTDGTADLATQAGARVLRCAKGRGKQLHAGAQASCGDVLLFLHADARLPETARGRILARLSDREVIGGNFRVRFLPRSWFTDILEPANDVRRRLTHRFYGDSAIFIRRSAYERLGGFKPYPLMEDYEFSARMERGGRCAYIRQPCVYASDRRFCRRELRTLLLWMTLQTLYWLRLPPRYLAALYGEGRNCAPERFLSAARRQVSGAAGEGESQHG